MKKKLYQTIEDRELYAPTDTMPDDPKKQERDLYRLGYVKIPRSMLYSSTFLSLGRSTKTVYMWLITKKVILAETARKGIMTEESKRYLDHGTCTTTAGELEKYTGISAKNVKRNLDELREAGLIKTKQMTIGGRKSATAYRIAEWQKDKTGYVKVPIKMLISPAYVALEHNDKLLYLLMLSQHTSAKKKNSPPFPAFTFAYSQIRAFGFASDTTIMTAIKRLKAAGMIKIDPGTWVLQYEQEEDTDKQINEEKKPQGKASTYWIKTDYLYINTDNNDNESNPATPE